jgi:nucleotide-binding universal stress UspA family protein
MDVAVALARNAGARVTLVHVWSIHPAVYTDGLEPSVIDRYQREAREALAGAFATLRKKGVRCESVFTSGSPADRILEIAKIKRVDLVVMGTHGRRGVSRFALGSVAEKVLRMAECPVLTVRPPRLRAARRRRDRAHAGASPAPAGIPRRHHERPGWSS